ncbi:hypothetical protein [Thermobifida halotolerans]|uniref:hypothetical protein n=1 Tax=Thermobifida halotolerans TaxID=483545 RepID=UPI0008399A83|nr:hypothetical protein [Thermobifida halotolerans]
MPRTAGGLRPRVYKQRHAAECGVDRVERHRAAAARYDGLAVRHQATVHIAAIDEWLRPALEHDLADALWDAYIAAPGDAPTLRETTFGGDRGLLPFRVDDDAESVHVCAITWIG